MDFLCHCGFCDCVCVLGWVGVGQTDLVMKHSENNSIP